MKSRARPSFWRAYDSLDPRAREEARRAYRLFLADPSPAPNKSGLQAFTPHHLRLAVAPRRIWQRH